MSPHGLRKDVLARDETHQRRASSLLSWYLRRAWAGAGLKWDSDNEREVEAIIEAIFAGALTEAKAHSNANINSHVGSYHTGEA